MCVPLGELELGQALPACRVTAPGDFAFCFPWGRSQSAAGGRRAGAANSWVYRPPACQVFQQGSSPLSLSLRQE